MADVGGFVIGWSLVFLDDGGFTINWTQNVTNFSAFFPEDGSDMRELEAALKEVTGYVEFDVYTRNAYIRAADVPLGSYNRERTAKAKKGDSTIIIVAAALALFLLVK